MKLKPKPYHIIKLWLPVLLITVFMPRASAQAPEVFGDNIKFGVIYTDSSTKAKQLATTTVPDLKWYGLKLKNVSLFLGMSAQSEIALGVKLNPKLTNYELFPVQSFSKYYAAYRIADSSDASLLVLGISPKNISEYRYRVVEDDTIELVHWSNIPKLEQQYKVRQPYGFIGKFNAPGKRLLIEVVNIHNYNIRDGVVFNWTKSFKPVITQLKIILNRDQKYAGVYLLSTKNHGFATKFDPVTGMPLDFKIPWDSVNSIQLTFKDHEFVHYDIELFDTKVRQVFTFSGSDIADNRHSLSIQDYPPGKYEIVVKPRFLSQLRIDTTDKNQELRIPIEILDSPKRHKTLTVTGVLVIAGLLTGIAAIIFLIYNNRNKRKLARSAQEKQMASLKLQSIRAQLNPHFMFNALTSIQNLVNKSDITGANRFLSIFAGLTRQVLDTGNEELLSIEQELQILDDYLQMEQLRFGFQYKITAAEDLNQANIDIPAMLLQPFVENAVKHGAAILKDTGKIEVIISKEINDVIFIIKDNGKGFDKDKTQANNGYGLKLSEERIDLLNQLYKDQPVSLHIESLPAGTKVSIRLSNWI